MCSMLVKYKIRSCEICVPSIYVSQNNTHELQKKGVVKILLRQKAEKQRIKNYVLNGT